MTRLLKKGTCFDWTPEVEHSFRSVKHEIANSTVLQPFHPNLQTYVTVDASEKGIGAILSQLDASNTEQVVTFWSRQLNTSEAKYSVMEKEALAAVSAVERWKIYL